MLCWVGAESFSPDYMSVVYKTLSEAILLHTDLKEDCLQGTWE